MVKTEMDDALKGFPTSNSIAFHLFSFGSLFATAASRDPNFSR